MKFSLWLRAVDQWFPNFLFHAPFPLLTRLHDTTGCQTGCTTGLTTRLYNRFDNRVERTATVRSTGCQTAFLTTGCIHDTAGCQSGF